MHAIRSTLVLAVAAAVAACSPAPTASPSGQASTSSQVTPTAATVTPIEPMAWTRTDLPIAVEGVFGGNLPRDVVGFDGGLVAVGAVNGGCCDGGFDPVTRALAWRSTDGIAWTLAPEADALHLGRMHGVATDGTSLVAIGTLDRRRVGHPEENDPEGAIWTSDDGMVWQRTPDAPPFGVLAGSEAGFASLTTAGPNPEAWWSETGADWEQVATADAMGPGVAIRLVHGPGGFIAVGEMATGAAVWTSVDGRSWERAPDQAAFAGGRMLDVAERAGRFVAVGEAVDSDSARIWLSDDARTWRRLELNDTADGVRFTRVLATEAGFLALAGLAGEAGPAVRVFASRDGSTWSPADPSTGLDDLDVHVAAWTTFDDGALVAVGDRWDREASEPVPVTWLIR